MLPPYVVLVEVLVKKLTVPAPLLVMLPPEPASAEVVPPMLAVSSLERAPTIWLLPLRSTAPALTVRL